jgi:aminoglycoside phosphotransferase (APT) family kinase protein
MTSEANPTDVLHGQLERLLRVEVRGLRRLSGGASRETWSFDSVEHDAGDGEIVRAAPTAAATETTAQPNSEIVRAAPTAAATETTAQPNSEIVRALICRRDPAYGARVGGMPLEARLFAAAEKAGVPVPRLIASGDASPNELDTGYLVMEHVAGETIARKILRDEPYVHARSVVVAQMGEALAKLHALPVDSVTGLEPIDPLQKYRDILDTFDQPSPTLELAYRWLVANRPAPIDPVIVHGDFRLGNMIINESGLAAVLDWELAHIGDPAEDLGWLCVRAWRFGGTKPVAGIGEYATLMHAYHHAGGKPIDESRVRWWELAGTFMWGVMCMGQANAHTSGAIRSVELAAIGRRVAEQEYDLLDLLGATPQLPTTSTADDGSSTQPTVSSVAGAPSAASLLEALREFLVNDVMTSTQGRVQFHARVASNVVSTIERELLLGDQLHHRHNESLEAVAVVERGLEGERTFAAQIRSGTFDNRLHEIAKSLAPVVGVRLAIANPKHAHP